MGANVWQRDGDSSRTFQVGARAPPQQHHGRGGRSGRGSGSRGSGTKRKLVWSRDGSAGAGPSAQQPQDSSRSAADEAGAQRGEPAPGRSSRTPDQTTTNSPTAGDTAGPANSADSNPAVAAAAEGVGAVKRQRADAPAPAHAPAPGKALNPSDTAFAGAADDANGATQGALPEQHVPGGTQSGRVDKPPHLPAPQARSGRAEDPTAFSSPQAQRSSSLAQAAPGTDRSVRFANGSDGAGSGSGSTAPQDGAAEAASAAARQQRIRNVAAAALAKKQQELLHMRRMVHQKQRRLTAQQVGLPQRWSTRLLSARSFPCAADR